MRNLIHISSLVAAAMIWLLGVFLGFQQPLFGIAGTCCSLGLMALAMRTAHENPGLGRLK